MHSLIKNYFRFLLFSDISIETKQLFFKDFKMKFLKSDNYITFCQVLSNEIEQNLKYQDFFSNSNEIIEILINLAHQEKYLNIFENFLLFLFKFSDNYQISLDFLTKTLEKFHNLNIDNLIGKIIANIFKKKKLLMFDEFIEKILNYSKNDKILLGVI